MGINVATNLYSSSASRESAISPSLLAGNLSHKEGALGEDAARADRPEQIDGARPRLGNSMTFVTLENGYTYDPAVLDASEIYTSYQHLHDEHLKNSLTVAPEKAGLVRYAAWMASRRACDYRGFYNDQQLEIHNTSYVYVGGNGIEFDETVCTCGLVCQTPKTIPGGELVHAKAIFEFDGHIRTSDRSLQTIFHIFDATGDETAKYLIFCQGCGILGDAPFDNKGKAGENALIALAETRANHVCSGTTESGNEGSR